MREFNRIIPAGESDSIAVDGEYIYLKSSNGSLFVKTDRGDSFTLSQENFTRVKAFKNIYLQNKNITSLDVTMVVGQSREEFGQYPNPEISGIGSTIKNTFSMLPYNATTLLIADNADRKEVMLQVRPRFSGSPGADLGIWLGDSTTWDTTEGILVNPGGILTLNTTAAIYGFNDNSGVTFVINILEVIK